MIVAVDIGAGIAVDHVARIPAKLDVTRDTNCELIGDDRPRDDRRSLPSSVIADDRPGTPLPL